MHLAFLTPEYPHSRSTPSAGLGSSIKNLALQLANRGIKVTVFVYGQSQDLVCEEKGLSFHFIKQRCYRFLGWWRYRKFLEGYINKTINAEKIDALEAADWTGITAFMRFRCPLVIRFHGSDSYFCNLENRPQKMKNFLFEKIGLQNADHLLSVSKFTAQKTVKIFGLEKRVKIIPNAVNTATFSPPNQETFPDTLLYFGSIIRKKGVLELAKIFNLVYQQNSSVQLIMAGRDVPDIQTGRSTKELFLEQLREEATENVNWLGNLPYDEIKEQISRAAVVVLPSFAEALPMTWLEAMAMKKALVTSNIGWANELMIDGQTGYTVDPKDHLRYAEKILELLRNTARSRKMGKAARERVEEYFSTEVVVERNIQFYRSIIQE